MAKRKKTSQKAQKLKRHFSAGGAVFRKVQKVREVRNVQQEFDTEWLIIRPAGTKRWQLPKGTIDQGEKSGMAAIREVFEETGVKAEIVNKLESVRYFYFQDGEKVFKTVIFFVMKSRGEEPTIDPKFADEVGEVIWTETSEALERLTFKGEKTILEKAVQIVI